MVKGLLSCFEDPLELARVQVRLEQEKERERNDAALRANKARKHLAQSAALAELLEVELAEETKSLVDLAASTREAYDRDWRRFAKWCAQEGLTALPATPETVAEFLISVAADDEPPMSRLMRMKAAISTVHRIHTAQRVSSQLDDNSLVLALIERGARDPNPCDDITVAAAMRFLRKRVKSDEPADTASAQPEDKANG